MVAPNYRYVAARVIDVDGVRGYNPGDLVPESVAAALRLEVGQDVTENERYVAPVEQDGEPAGVPARSASQADWVAYATTAGVGTVQAEAMTKDELIEALGGE